MQKMINNGGKERRKWWRKCQIPTNTKKTAGEYKYSDYVCGMMPERDPGWVRRTSQRHCPKRQLVGSKLTSYSTRVLGFGLSLPVQSAAEQHTGSSSRRRTTTLEWGEARVYVTPLEKHFRYTITLHKVAQLLNQRWSFSADHNSRSTRSRGCCLRSFRWRPFLFRWWWRPWWLRCLLFRVTRPDVTTVFLVVEAEGAVKKLRLTAITSL